MKKTVIFGNSGSGKSTLAKNLCDLYQLAHLDLDILAWQATNPPQRKPVDESAITIKQFTEQNQQWIIEGCYTDLIALAIEQANEIIFLNPGIETCISNAKLRPWEPHKYESPEAQEKNLGMLIDWIRDYEVREDEFSLKAHKQLYDSFLGRKTEYNSNQRQI
ncbi:MAG: shikimate kinase [Gammaproteobacteria bacterium]|nr:shikimate kinase [Gammaproteobacteria bacterium]